MSARHKRTTRRASRRPPASGRKPTDRISARDVSMTADELQFFHRQFQPLFQRREQRAWSLLYLCGQLSNLERKTIEPMVLSLLGADPNAIRGMQQFIGQGEWDSAVVSPKLKCHLFSKVELSPPCGAGTVRRFLESGGAKPLRQG